ncbi:hypothetical protein [Aquamicrobium sp.]|uniref:hypothetical protein n=1 Tax=Aquamicrobium sp. TaxID=1872579 RepID=UPI0025897D72|nr:hypothetical protein [Aquamicrobium sp.]MCK9549124.1 hypothetical protein [Aquamicrobium sp.]
MSLTVCTYFWFDPNSKHNLNYVSPPDNVRMMQEMQRVACKGIIWTARVSDHPHARTRELFESALDGWKITRDEAGYTMAYRIMMAEPV